MNATGYGCAFGDESHKVNWLVTRLHPSVTISLCDEDFPVGIILVLASELGVDGGRLYDTIKRFVDREQARENREHAQAEATAATITPDGMSGPCEHEYTSNEAGTHEWCQKCDSVRPIEQVTP